MNSTTEAVIFLSAAVIAVPLFRLLKLSSILGYVAAGIVIGPWGLRLISDVERIMHTAEFGVALLLFVIGLELQPTRLLVMRRKVFGLGSAQVALCTLLLGCAAMLFLGLQSKAAFVVGFGLSLSSTALVLQILAERGQLKTQHGRGAFGILLFQDLAVLPMLAILPLVSPMADGVMGHNPSGVPWYIGLAKLVGAVVGVVAAGRLLLRPALRIVARIRVTEVFTAAALLTALGTALIIQSVGLSMALGAFLAGVLLADSEFRHELEADIEPFKGLLLGLFFISVGMAANLGLLSQQPLLIIGVTLGLLFIKLLAVSAVGRFAKFPGDAPWRLGFALAAGGEFAFVLFTLAAKQRLLEMRMADVLILSVTLSMMIGPLLALLYESKLHPYLTGAAKPEFDSIDEQGTRAIIAGFGRFGQIIARVLRARRIKFTALDVNQTHVDFVRRFGNKVYYGDASRLDLLRSAGVADADVFVIAIDDVDASLRTAEILRTHFPHLKVFARARNRQHAFALMDRGVKNVIRETFLSSLDMAGDVLQALGETEARVETTLRRFRRHDEQTLQAQYAVKDDEEKLLSTSREAAKQLEKLFEADEVAEEPRISALRRAP
jgi:monovalent cation:proton antiporter-2 (CPA2) family protein